MKITVHSQVGLQRHQATLQISKIEINDLSTFLVHCCVNYLRSDQETPS